jgi:hypothetical protein
MFPRAGTWVVLAMLGGVLSAKSLTRGNWDKVRLPC